jgi:NADH-quinone oxidoreductase subunit J
MLTLDLVLATLVVGLGASGTYLLLPHRHGATPPRRQHIAGLILAAAGLAFFLTLLNPPGPFLAATFFYLFTVVALASAIMTVTSRNPVYSALWFAAVVLATSGLFLQAGASFLAAGTVIVYAGAIIVTFLFVIMLAQMEGKAQYDRAARAPGVATFTCFLILWCLVYALLALPRAPRASTNTLAAAERSPLPKITSLADSSNPRLASSYVPVLDHALQPTSRIDSPASEDRVTEKPNVAALGAALYTDHLVTVGLSGVLLFVALVGAVAITNPKKPGRPPVVR